MSVLDKRELVLNIISKIEGELALLRAAAIETYAAATGDESKPENKYDTRALEASYLAGAQAKRVLSLEKTLNIYRILELKDFGANDPIQSTALIEVSNDDREFRVFIVPVTESLQLEHEGCVIQVITPQSPLGQALLGRKTGDSVRIKQGPRDLEYEILSIQ